MKTIKAKADDSYVYGTSSLWVGGTVTDGIKDVVGRHALMMFDNHSMASLIAFLAEMHPDTFLAVAGAISACDVRAAEHREYRRRSNDIVAPVGQRRSRILRNAAGNALESEDR